MLKSSIWLLFTLSISKNPVVKYSALLTNETLWSYVQQRGTVIKNYSSSW
jgi:hypothetical protein